MRHQLTITGSQFNSRFPHNKDVSVDGSKPDSDHQTERHLGHKCPLTRSAFLTSAHICSYAVFVTGHKSLSAVWTSCGTVLFGSAEKAQHPDIPRHFDKSFSCFCNFSPAPSPIPLTSDPFALTCALCSLYRQTDVGFFEGWISCNCVCVLEIASSPCAGHN